MSILLMPILASASPAQSISSFDIISYAYHISDGGPGWYADEDVTISKSDLTGLWCNTTQEGYGNISSVKIDGRSVDYNVYNKVPGTKDGNVVLGWITQIKITDSSYISNLSSGSHTLSVVCSTTNTFPSRTLSSSVTFNVE
jgi:hypothetical protein